MAKLLLFYVLACLGFVLACTATLYTVGDTSGWDISTDIDSWAKDKTFKVGDILMFLYSSSQSVNEVTRNSFYRCDVNNTLQTFAGMNTTITLTKPGERFFICGKRLYCLGGMKLHVVVDGDQAASSPASAPQAIGLQQRDPSSLPRPSSKNSNALNYLSASTGFPLGGRDSLVIACIGVFVTLLSVPFI